MNICFENSKTILCSIAMAYIYFTHSTRAQQELNNQILTSFFIASKISVFSSFKQWLIRARRFFSIIGLLLCKRNMIWNENKRLISFVGFFFCVRLFLCLYDCRTSLSSYSLLPFPSAPLTSLQFPLFRTSIHDILSCAEDSMEGA